MEQAQNTFLEGLITDYNPIVTPNTSMTDALNATLITMNGNETTLQNDMGNARVETAFLPNGYVPVGIAEHAGIIYVASHNPLTNKSLIGSFPSPERILDEAESNNWSWDKEIEVKCLKQIEDCENPPCGCETFDDKVTTISGSPIQTFINQKQLFEGKTLHPGDKFLITWDKENNESKFLSNYNNITNEDGETKAYSPKNNVLTYKVMILDSGNNLIDITNTLKRFNIEDPYGELKENGYDLVDFNTGYFMLPTPNDLKDNSNGLIAAREVNFNTSATKITGKLYLAREYNIIDHIDVEYKLKGFVTDPNRMEAIFNITYYYNCPDDVKLAHEYVEPNLPSYLSLNSSYEINRKESEIHYSIGEFEYNIPIKYIGSNSTPYRRDQHGVISIIDNDNIKFKYLKEDDFYYYKLNQEDNLKINLQPDSIGGVDGATVTRTKDGISEPANLWTIYKDLAKVVYNYETIQYDPFLSDIGPEEISRFGTISGDKIIIQANTNVFLYIEYNGYKYHKTNASDTIVITLMSNFLHDTIQTSNTGQRLIKADKIYIPNLKTSYNVDFPFYKKISGEQTIEYTSLPTYNYNLKFNFGGNDLTYDELIESGYITDDIDSSRSIEVYNKFPFYFFTKGLVYITLEDEKLGEKITINNDSQITDKLFVLNYKANEIIYLTKKIDNRPYPTNFTRHKFSVIKDISKTGLVNYNTETNLYNVTNSFKILINKDGDNYKLDKKIYSELDSSEISRSPELDEPNAKQCYSDSFRKTYYRVYEDLYNYNTIKGVNLDFEIDGNFLNYKITPSMTYSNGLTALIQKDKLDLTKLNSNLLEVTNWRYFVNDNDEDPYVELVLGLLDYTDERHYVSSVSVELYDVTRFSSNDLSVETLEGIKINTPKIIYNDDISDYEEDPDYVIDSLQTGNHTTSISFNDEFQQRKLYVCYIYYTLVDKNKHNDLGVKTLCAVRWMMTTPLFNGFYNTTADFNSLEAKDEEDQTWEEYLKLTPTAWDVESISYKSTKETVTPEYYMDVSRTKESLTSEPLNIDFRTYYDADIQYSSGFLYKEDYYPDDVKYIKYVTQVDTIYKRTVKIYTKTITSGSAKVLYSLEGALLKSEKTCNLYKNNNGYWIKQISEEPPNNAYFYFVCYLTYDGGIVYTKMNPGLVLSFPSVDSHSGRSGLGQITGVDRFIKEAIENVKYLDKNFDEWDLYFIKSERSENTNIKLNQEDIGSHWIFAIIKTNKSVGIDDNKRTVYAALPIMFYDVNNLPNEHSLFSLYFKGLGFLDVYVDGKDTEQISNLLIYDKTRCNDTEKGWERNEAEGNIISCPNYINHLTDQTSSFANLMKFYIPASSKLSFLSDFLTKNDKHDKFINYILSIDENNYSIVKKQYYNNQGNLETYNQIFPSVFSSGVLYDADGTVNETFNGRFKINYSGNDIESVIINANSEEYVNHGPYETTNPNNVSKVYYVDWHRKFYLNVDVNKKDDLDATHNYQLYLLTGLNIKEKDYGTNPDNSYFYIDLSKDPDSDSTFAGEDDAEY